MKAAKRKTRETAVTDINALGTERVNPAYRELDRKSALQIARILNQEDRKVPLAIESAVPQIARAIDMVADAFRRGGRLIYVGTGTSGRLGALDSSECPPTYNSAPERVQYVIAGGDAALSHAVEASEDSAEDGARDLAAKRPGKRDVVCGLSASGRTPYTIAALQYARKKGAQTICVTANPGSAITRSCDLAIAIDVGPEVVAGSTRMKAGTMQKLVLNMISTGAFIRIGYVYRNLMVNVHLKNHKLVERGVSMVEKLTGVDEAEARELLQLAGGSVPVAVLMYRQHLPRATAERRLKAAGGSLREALDGVEASKSKSATRSRRRS